MAKRKLTDEQCVAIREEYAAGGISERGLAKKLGLTRETVRYALKPEPKKASSLKWARENRPAVNVHSRAWRLKNPMYYITANAKWARENPTGVAGKNSRRRARRLATSVEPIDLKHLVQLSDSYCSTCVYCNTVKTLTLDHIIPLSRGGAHTLDNLTMCCKSCNSSKGVQLLSEWRGGVHATFVPEFAKLLAEELTSAA